MLSYVNQIRAPEFETDTFFPLINTDIFTANINDSGGEHEENGVKYTVSIRSFSLMPFCFVLFHFSEHQSQLLQYITYKRSTLSEHEERQYLQLVQRIINHGNNRDDRTGVGMLYLSVI